MDDQARQLRQLVRDSVLANTAGAAGRPRMVVLSGGKGGVGTTTLTVNLAAAAADQGVRTVLVDADPDGGDVASLCGIREAGHLGDVLSGRRPASALLQRGPGKLLVLPGAWRSEKLADCTALAVDNLIEQLCGLGDRSDLVLVDAGNTMRRSMARFWRAADRVLVVSSPESAAVLDSYAAIKTLGDGIATPIFSLVNKAPHSDVADDVHGRLTHACRRFLGLSLGVAGHVSADPQADGWRQRGIPAVLGAPRAAMSAEIRRIAAWLTEAIDVADRCMGPDGNQKRTTRMTA